MSSLHSLLLEWYRAHGRHALSWRETRDPYAIYVSEIMLQQTQVSTVQERYYPQFMARFPTLLSVAEASLDEVLSLWQGLGYYARARHLHATAIQTQGQLPSTLEGLIALPGIGRNTAHAILSFAHGQPYPVMETNVKRILCRFYGIQEAKLPQIWELAEQFFNPREPFAHNQAMMDIGATICTPKAPACPQCPFVSECIAATRNPTDYPTARVKKAIPKKQRYIAMHMRGPDAIALSKREDARLLKGLYGFPQHETLEELGKEARYIGTVQHSYSHFKLQADAYLVQDAHASTKDLHFVTVADTPKMALSTLDKKLLNLLQSQRVKLDN